ncbi:unnamed protein product [Protopolystoma xenopodis]|uniref:Uncharacterized protein n=1 Tax=Protopolystoma xenopodis TaxID=117903 RepID=A0A3S5CJG8_9PLAT|nr:unnamed protein product [Protopolystoma xenopodis]
MLVLSATRTHRQATSLEAGRRVDFISAQLAGIRPVCRKPNH